MYVSFVTIEFSKEIEELKTYNRFKETFAKSILKEYPEENVIESNLSVYEFKNINKTITFELHGNKYSEFEWKLDCLNDLLINYLDNIIDFSTNNYVSCDLYSDLDSLIDYAETKQN